MYMYVYVHLYMYASLWILDEKFKSKLISDMYLNVSVVYISLIYLVCSNKNYQFCPYLLQFISNKIYIKNYFFASFLENSHSSCE